MSGGRANGRRERARRLPIWGALGAAFLLLAPRGWLAAQPGAQSPEGVVIVNLYWPEHKLRGAQVRLFRDKTRQELVGAFPGDRDSGRVVIAASPGTYYLTAIVDSNENGQLDAGDGLGFYGVEEPTTQEPQPLEVRAGLTAITLPISLQLAEAGKLVPTGVRLPQAAEETRPSVRLAGQLRGGTGRLCFCCAVSTDGRASYAVLVAPNGSFSLRLPAGEYYLFAVEDTNETEGLEAGDRWAVPDYMPELGAGFPRSAIKEQKEGLSWMLAWRLTDEGRLEREEDKRQGPTIARETLPAILFGQISNMLPDGQAWVRVGTDSRFRTIVAEAASDREGRFTMALPAGVYYVSIWGGPREPQANESAKLSPAAGDRIGFYGVSDPRKAHGPQPVALSPGELRRLEIAFTARLDEALRPMPVP